jgi:hypothetical protein
MLKDKNNLRAGFWYLLCENISFHKSCHFLDIYSWWEILMEIQRQRLIRVPWLGSVYIHSTESTQTYYNFFFQH